MQLVGVAVLGPRDVVLQGRGPVRRDEDRVELETKDDGELERRRSETERRGTGACFLFFPSFP